MASHALNTALTCGRVAGLSQAAGEENFDCAADELLRVPWFTLIEGLNSRLFGVFLMCPLSSEDNVPRTADTDERTNNRARSARDCQLAGAVF